MRSTEEWKFWGQYDPMWAVATWKGRERDGAEPWTIDDFRASGRSDCSDIMRHWDHYGRSSGGVCIEIGCGSGRLTSALLNHFDRILAVDVSPEQVRLSREVLGEAEKGDIPSRRYRAFDYVRTSVSRALGRYRFMEYNRYPASRIVQTLSSIGYQDVEIRIFRITLTNFRQSFFFARKGHASR